MNLHSRSGGVGVVGMALCGAAAFVLLSGCEQPKPGNGSGTKPAQTGAAPMTPIAATVLRERAIEVVELESANVDPTIRASAVAAAAMVPSRLGALVEKGLDDPNSGVRGVTAMAIGRAQIKGHTNRLTRLLNDSEVITQVSATYALIRTGANVDRSPLASWLMNDPSPWVKRQTVDVLGLLGDRSAMPLLKSAARERFPSLGTEQNRILQLLLAEAMIRLGDDEQRPVIRAALYPPTPDELETAALAVSIIGEIQDKEAIAQLIYLSQYKDKAGQQYPAEIRLAVASTLAKLGKPQGYFIADEYVGSTNPVLRAQCALVYGVTKGPQNSQKLATLMGDPEALVRVAAAGAVLRGNR